MRRLRECVFLSCAVGTSWTGVSETRAAGSELNASAPSLPIPDLGALAVTAAQLILLVGIILIGFLLIVRWLVRKSPALRRTRSAGNIEVIESQRLDAKRRVHLVRIGSQRVLIASGEGAITALAISGSAAEDRRARRSADSEDADGLEFQSLLNGSGTRHETSQTRTAS